jgi:uncharacterized membrane protein YhhN
MRSFAFALEPHADPRVAAAALLAHGAASLSPWLAHLDAPVAMVLSILAAAGCVATLRRVPGPYSALAAVAFDSLGCRARLAGALDFAPAEIQTGSRAMAGLVCLEIRTGGRRLGWLLRRGSVPEADFRRLKARIRLTC